MFAHGAMRKLVNNRQGDEKLLAPNGTFAFARTIPFSFVFISEAGRKMGIQQPRMTHSPSGGGDGGH